jgi:hypothetical protein
MLTKNLGVNFMKGEPKKKEASSRILNFMTSFQPEVLSSMEILPKTTKIWVIIP